MIWARRRSSVCALLSLVPSFASAATRARTHRPASLAGERLASVDLSGIQIYTPYIEPPRPYPALRAGLSVAGGAVVDNQFGPAISASARLGIQSFAGFGMYYQNTLAISHNDGGGWFNLYDWNVLALSFVLGNRVEIAGGPSVDYVHDAFRCSARCVDWSAFAVGANARLAVMFPTFGRRRREAEQRRGVSLALEVHPTFAPQGTQVLVSLGLGVELY